MAANGWRRHFDDPIPLFACAGIKLNIRVLLRLTLETLIIFAVVQNWPTPHPFRP
jgi:hypothetical protein